MVKRVFRKVAFSAAIVGMAAFPHQVGAQSDDIELAGEALERCAASPDYLGYPSLQICMEAVYQQLLAAKHRGDPYEGGDYSGPGSDPFDYCRVNCR